MLIYIKTAVQDQTLMKCDKCSILNFTALINYFLQISTCSSTRQFFHSFYLYFLFFFFFLNLQVTGNETIKNIKHAILIHTGNASGFVCFKLVSIPNLNYHLLIFKFIFNYKILFLILISKFRFFKSLIWPLSL